MYDMFMVSERRLISALQENYLLEVRGDVQESLPPSVDESSGNQTLDSQTGDHRVYYMVHPSVDTEGSSSVL